MYFVLVIICTIFTCFGTLIYMIYFIFNIFKNFDNIFEWLQEPVFMPGRASVYVTRFIYNIFWIFMGAIVSISMIKYSMNEYKDL